MEKFIRDILKVTGGAGMMMAASYSIISKLESSKDPVNDWAFFLGHGSFIIFETTTSGSGSDPERLAVGQQLLIPSFEDAKGTRKKQIACHNWERVRSLLKYLDEPIFFKRVLL